MWHRKNLGNRREKSWNGEHLLIFSAYNNGTFKNLNHLPFFQNDGQLYYFKWNPQFFIPKIHKRFYSEYKSIRVCFRFKDNSNRVVDSYIVNKKHAHLRILTFLYAEKIREGSPFIYKLCYTFYRSRDPPMVLHIKWSSSINCF